MLTVHLKLAINQLSTRMQ